MTKSIRSAIMLFVFVSLMISPTKSSAWSCFENQEPKALFKKSDFVYVAKAIDSSYAETGSMNKKSRTTFEVKSALKGEFSEKVTIVTTGGSTFTEGIDYLVYAYQTTESNYLYNYEPGEIATDTMCGGTKPLALASSDLEEIAEFKKMNKLIYFIILPLSTSAVIVTLFLLLKRFKNSHLRRR